MSFVSRMRSIGDFLAARPRRITAFIALAGLVLLAGFARFQRAEDDYVLARTLLLDSLLEMPFEPDRACSNREKCAALLEELRHGDATIISPVEVSDQVDELPIFNSIRRSCRALDITESKYEALPLRATKNFALYIIPAAERISKNTTALIFRAEDYVSPIPGRWSFPGNYIVVTYPRCEVVKALPVQKGVVHRAGTYRRLSEVINLGGSIYILNIYPIVSEIENDDVIYVLRLWELTSDARKFSNAYSVKAKLEPK